MDLVVKKALDPLNITLINYAEFIKLHACQEVTSHYIHEPSSQAFAKGGLFDEETFGRVGTSDRFLKHGFINLRCKVFHPVIFSNILSIKRFYGDIISGKEMAKWDKELGDFVRADGMDDPDADTGFTFFLKYYPLINWTKNKSLKRNDKINVLAKFSKIALTDKFLVIPAGIRDMKEEDGRIEKDSINSLYLSLLTSTKAMPDHGGDDPIYDVIHYSIQKKVMDIYNYLMTMVEGKRGFLQGKLGHRHVVGGTRNVITATNLEAISPEHPQFHKVDEVKVPLYQAAKGYASLVVYQIRSIFYSSVINQTSDSVALINPATLKLEYVPVDPRDRDILLTEEGIQKTIDRFRDPEFRFKPVKAMSGGKPYYLYLVYDNGNEITVFRNLTEFKNDYGEKFDEKKVRPLTYGEMLYIATFFASYGKSGTITRYPVTGPESIFPSKTHLMSTTPGRVVTLVSKVTEDETKQGVQLPEYPVMGAKFVDALMFHPSRRAGLTADYDGDTVSWIPILSDEANKECEEYNNSLGSYINPDGKAQLGTDDLVCITLRTLTADCKELH